MPESGVKVGIGDPLPDQALTVSKLSHPSLLGTGKHEHPVISTIHGCHTAQRLKRVAQPPVAGPGHGHVHKPHPWPGLTVTVAGALVHASPAHRYHLPCR